MKKRETFQKLYYTPRIPKILDGITAGCRLLENHGSSCCLPRTMRRLCFRRRSQPQSTSLRGKCENIGVYRNTEAYPTPPWQRQTLRNSTSQKKNAWAMDCIIQALTSPAGKTIPLEGNGPPFSKF